MHRLLFVLLFLIRIRLARSQNFPEYVRVRYGQPTLLSYRRLESSLRKQRKAELDSEFLLYCQVNNVIPNFLKFKLYRQSLHHSVFYHEATSKLLEMEIRYKTELCNKHKYAVDSLFASLCNSLSFLDCLLLKHYVKKNINSFVLNVKNVHQRKMHNLGISVPNFLNPKKVVFNYSDYQLSEREEFLLSLGLDFCLPNFKPSYSQYFLSFETLFNRLCKLSILPDLKKLQGELQHFAQRSFMNLKSNWLPFFRKEDYNLLKQLSLKSDLIITKPDKGKGTVILNKQDYITKMNTILSDRSKFEYIGSPAFQPIFRTEDKINRFLKSLKDRDIINDHTYSLLYSSGCSYGVLYGLPKVHKENIPLRPILASYNTPSYKLAKYLAPLLQPFSENQFTLSNSSTFAKDIVTQDLDLYMVSLDVVSLFTNVPLQATIQIILDKIFIEPNFIYHGFNRDDFEKLLKLAVLDTDFLFDGKQYKQIDGVAMGSPLGPVLANIFMCHIEDTIFNQCSPSFRPVFYKRYVDDTFILFQTKVAAEQFLDFANTLHPNINFTIEYENNDCLPFLDILIKRSDQHFSTSVYRKQTYTGLGSNFYSSCFFNFKLNSIRTLLHRAYSHSSDWINFHNEVEFLRNFFRDNCFPEFLFNKYLKKFIDNIFQPKMPLPTVPKLDFYASLPYTSDRNFLPFLKQILTKHFNCLNPKLVLRNQRTIGSLFRFKDTVPSLMRSLVVYKYTCPRCNLGTYVGSTKRMLKVRIDSHRGISHRTGSTLNKKEFSNIREHANRCKSTISYDDFDIVTQAPDEASLFILESLCIKQLVPSLNNQSSSAPLFIA